MKDFLQAVASLAAIAIIALISFMVGRHGYPKCPAVEGRIDTVVRVDTLRDTARIPVGRCVTRTETVRLPTVETVRTDTLYIRDTVTVEVPVERVEYRTPEYYVVVEGFRPSLVSMEIYRQTQFIDRLQTVKVPDVRRWGIGPYVGYGITIQNGRIIGVPTVGVSVQYAIIKW